MEENLCKEKKEFVAQCYGFGIPADSFRHGAVIGEDICELIGFSGDSLVMYDLDEDKNITVPFRVGVNGMKAFLRNKENHFFDDNQITNMIRKLDKSLRNFEGKNFERDAKNIGLDSSFFRQGCYLDGCIFELVGIDKDKLIMENVEINPDETSKHAYVKVSIRKAQEGMLRFLMKKDTFYTPKQVQELGTVIKNMQYNIGSTEILDACA